MTQNLTTAQFVADPAPFKIGFTLKASSEFQAEWLTPTVWGHTAQETAERGAELLTALKAVGLIDLTSKAAQYTRDQYKGGGGSPSTGPKRFEGGRVVSKTSAGLDDDQCEHGRKLVDKGSWSAMFCQAQPKGAQCEPLWKQPDGSFKAK
ncbi:hypothetical protein [Kitasatospora sp. MAA19]|uniref:hypothetical protein n=1 Tax=Kitasatospora sp. MAA19 TaxID=3035090 RepID=UPI002472F5FA|nr:hypothetical protein [Kitasatospora sp. MAA19]